MNWLRPDAIGCGVAALAAAVSHAAAASTGVVGPAAAPAAIEHAAPWADALPFGDRPPADLARLIRTSDILAYAAPGRLYPKRHIGLQCQGTNATLADVPKGTARTATLRGASSQRFGEAQGAAERAFRLQVDADDLLEAGASSRCELLAYPAPATALPRNDVFWLAFTIWVDDWSGTTDEQSVAQMHVDDRRPAVLNPFFAMVLRGSELRVELRHNASPTPDRASTTLITARRMAMPVRQWVTAVIQARLGQQDAPARPFLRLWLNDELVADHDGPLGYMPAPESHAYWKVGVYHWKAGNPWDTSMPSRAMLLRAALAVRDPMQRYDTATLRAALLSPR